MSNVGPIKFTKFENSAIPRPRRQHWLELDLDFPFVAEDLPFLPALPAKY